MAASSASQSSPPSPTNGSRLSTPLTPLNIQIPSSLKFLLNSVRTLIQSPLTSENYLLWSSQVSNLFSANGFASYLDPNTIIPDNFILDSAGKLTHNPLYDQWNLIDKNLRAVLQSVISPPILTHVLTLTTTAEIWVSLSTRFQSTNRSRLLQLKQALQQVAMKFGNMETYLTEVKRLVDLLAASGSPTSIDDVILYTLNGLPPTYHSFQTSIRTRPGLLPLEEFYNLLVSEELHLARLASHQTTNDTYAFSSTTRYPRNQPRNNQNPHRGGGRPTPPNRSHSTHPPNRQPTPHPPKTRLCVKFAPSPVIPLAGVGTATPHLPIRLLPPPIGKPTPPSILNLLHPMSGILIVVTPTTLRQSLNTSNDHPITLVKIR